MRTALPTFVGVDSGVLYLKDESVVSARGGSW